MTWGDDVRAAIKAAGLDEPATGETEEEAAAREQAAKEAAEVEAIADRLVGP